MPTSPWVELQYCVPPLRVIPELHVPLPPVVPVVPLAVEPAVSFELQRPQLSLQYSLSTIQELLHSLVSDAH